MFGQKSRAKEVFESQFEEDGDDFLYRKGKTTHPVRVTRTERDRFCETFARQLRWLIVGSVGALILPIGTTAFLAPDLLDGPDKDRIMWIFVAVFIAAFFTIWHSVWRAPARALADRAPAGRAPAGRARSKAEARRHAIESISWSQLATGGAITGFLMLRLALEDDLTRGWHRLWLVSGAGMAILLLVQCFRKWRLT